MRLEKGLFRYLKTGQIWEVRREGCKVRWTNLKTDDLDMARLKSNRSPRPKPENWMWKQAQKVISHYAKEHQVDVPDAVNSAQVGQAPPKTGAPHTLAECFNSWKRTWTVAEGTKETREAHWRMLGRVLKPETRLEAITITGLKEAQAKLKDSGLSPTSINDVMFKTLRRSLEHAVEIGWLVDNPAARLKPLKRVQSIRQQPSWEEAWKLVDKACEVAPESGELLRFMLAFGVGQKEVKNLKGEHIDFERDVVHFLRQKTGKTFDVPILSAEAKHLLNTLRAAGRIQVGKPVFEWRDPEQALHGACERLRMPVYTPRSLRRTFIIHALEQEVDPRVVAKWQGHRDAKLILDTYGSYVSKEHEKAQIAKITKKK
ncbi:MAG TPA: tyrosine-type recombinase/integrase [Verrucomicrobiae bacterium]